MAAIFRTDEHRSLFPLGSLVSGANERVDYRTELNNYLQVNGGCDRLRWEETQTGLQHKLTWTAICYSGCPLLQQSCP